MLYAIPRKKVRRKVAFLKPTVYERLSQKSSLSWKTNSRTAEQCGHAVDEDNITDVQAYEKMSPSAHRYLFPDKTVEEELETESSVLQDQTAEECIPFLTSEASGLNASGLPTLSREKHVRFLRHWLGRLPAGFAVLDASRPWILHWCLNGLALLGDELTEFEDR